jgi:acid phosphatase (class A)
MKLRTMARNRQAAVVLGGLMLAACATGPVPSTDAATLKGPAPGMLKGYLAPNEVLNSLQLLPPPPQPGSPAQAADDAAYRAALVAKGSARWQLAIRDAETRFPQAADAFSCALNMPINAQTSPHLLTLMQRSLTDLGVAYEKSKNHYQRPRPYVVFLDGNCTPDDKSNKPNQAYPSGHATAGWGLALTLIEVAPERAGEIAARGYAFAQSRVACGVHWQSDVNAGRDLGAAVVAQLHSNPEFVAQLAQARKEVAVARAAGGSPSRDCTEEAAALAR